MLSRRSLVWSVCLCLLVLVANAIGGGGDGIQGSGRESASDMRVVHDSTGFALSLGERPAFHRSNRAIADARLIEFDGSSLKVALWNEESGAASTPYYAISLDGETITTIRDTSYELKLRHGAFDPKGQEPKLFAGLAADQGTNLFIVQFVTQPLQPYRDAVVSLGGTVHHYLAKHAHIVEMDAATAEGVAALAFVRWVGPYHPAYRFEEAILNGLGDAQAMAEAQRYHIQVVRRGLEQKLTVAARVEALGGVVHDLFPEGSVFDATLSPDQLLEIARMNEVFFLDRWFPPQAYMNNVREDGGANHIETVAGYTGAGVRGEVMDSGLSTSHQAFQGVPPIVHTCNNADTSHGTAVFGINFGDGTGNAAGRGLVPDAQGFIASYHCVGNRFQHTLELVQAPYHAVYQTNSWGSCCVTSYGTASQAMDDMIFQSDLVILQAQANDGSRFSDVSAWAKNVVSVGGIRHQDTLSRADDNWSNAGSIGPADDGRVKPDLSYWYDSILTTSNSGGYTTGFGGTSAATPMTAGYFGLFHQMWADGLFGNEVNPGGTVFENRPHNTTARAMMINSAHAYPFAGSGSDLTRVHQGWGTADVSYLYDMRDKITAIDESVVLQNLETASFLGFVEPGEPELRVTLVYLDPPGTTSSSQHRINDLTLKVTTPSSTVYWGNNGLLTGNWSTPGGSANTIDVVENVFIQNPESGVWTIEVIASEINQDAHIETPEVDADFALVLSGGLLSNCSPAGIVTLNAPKYSCTSQATIRVVDCDLNTDDMAVETVAVNVKSTTESSGETVILTETGPVTADFRAAIDLSTVDAVGTLQIAEGDTVTATYIDADDGLGGLNVEVTANAVVDCSPPLISNVTTTNIEAQNATVTFDTDELAKGTVRYGTSCGSLTESATEISFLSNHAVDLMGLTADTTYFYAVDADDEAGNTGTDDNGGGCFSFATPDVPDFFTEAFTGNFDLANTTVTLTPIGGNDLYSACTESATAFPTDPTGGSPISLGDDASVAINLSGGEMVELYGTAYGTFFVGSNGYITFTTGDGDWDETIPEHFDLPRVAGLYDDLNPSVGGTVSWKQLADRAAMTWQGVPEYNTTNSNNFQIELFFDGTIRITWLAIASSDSIVGLSEGAGEPPVFIESNLSGYGACDCLIVTPGTALVSSGPVGGPFTPPCATYTLTNGCAQPLDWTATGTQSWVEAAPTGGTLVAFGNTTVDICIGVDADAFSQGNFSDTAKITNATSSAVFSRDVSLDVLTVPPALGDDTCYDGQTDLGTPCGTDADCGVGQACGTKSRYLAITPPTAATAGGTPSTLKVTTPGGDYFAGPEAVLLDPPHPDLMASPLQCVPTEAPTPHAQIWSSGVLYLYGAAIMPQQTYEVRMCDAAGANCSAPVVIGTGKWGDVVGAFGGSAQPNFADITEAVNVFKELAGAAMVPRADMVPEVPGGNVDFADITACVDGFKGDDYPYPGPTSCP